jgi:hypothetical protein
MFARLFGRFRPPLPATSAELSEALRTAAQFADSDAARLEYTNAADALDRAITYTNHHGDEPTRDALAYALGRAELNLKDQMTELIDISKDTHIIVQGVQITVQGVEKEQSEQGAAVVALRAEFLTFGETVSSRMLDIEAHAVALEARVTAHDQSRDQSIEDRRLLRQDMNESQAHRARIQSRLDTELPAISAAIRAQDERHGKQLDAFGQRLASIERLLEVAGEQHDRANGGGNG